MAQPEQNTLFFVSEDADQIIDLAAALTAVNRKQYHMTKGFSPLNYHVRAQCITTGGDADPIQFSTAPNTWTTRNAVNMLGAQYRKQLKENGVRISQLPKYGREFRLGLQTNVGYTHGTGTEGYQDATLDASGANKVYMPVDGQAAESFADYTNSDGATVSYESSNDLTIFSIPPATSGGGAEAVVVALTGTTDHANNDLALIPEYLASRRNAHDHVDVDHDMPSDTSLLLRLGSSGAEHFDDLIDALEETGTERPYNNASANTLYMQGMLGAVGDYCSFVAPLGLIKVDGNADSKFLLTVTAITEM